MNKYIIPEGYLKPTLFTFGSISKTKTAIEAAAELLEQEDTFKPSFTSVCGICMATNKETQAFNRSVMEKANLCIEDICLTTYAYHTIRVSQIGWFNYLKELKAS